MSDFFLLIESFKIFFEKVLTVVTDPSGVAIQEWLKFKDVLTAKDASSASAYSYANQIVVQPNTEQIVKVKQAAVGRRDSKKVSTPSKITRRNSFGSDSPSNSALQKQQKEGGATQDLGIQAPSKDNIGQPAEEATSQGGFALLANPWIVDANNSKLVGLTSPTMRVGTNDIQHLKGLSDFSKTQEDTKQIEAFNTSKGLLLGKMRKCIEQYKRDSVGLDLIHDRSFATQTMLVDNKRKPEQKGGIKRQDSKFIREFSMYSKKGSNQIGETPSNAQLQQKISQQQQQQLPNAPDHQKPITDWNQYEAKPPAPATTTEVVTAAKTPSQVPLTSANVTGTTTTAGTTTTTDVTATNTAVNVTHTAQPSFNYTSYQQQPISSVTNVTANALATTSSPATTATTTNVQSYLDLIPGGVHLDYIKAKHITDYTQQQQQIWAGFNTQQYQMPSTITTAATTTTAMATGVPSSTGIATTTPVPTSLHTTSAVTTEPYQYSTGSGKIGETPSYIPSAHSVGSGGTAIGGIPDLSYLTQPIGGATGIPTSTATTTINTNATTTTTVTQPPTTSNTTASDAQKKQQDIDDLVQRIIKQQKEKDEQNKLNSAIPASVGNTATHNLSVPSYMPSITTATTASSTSQEQDKLVQDIIQKHKLQQQQSVSSSPGIGSLSYQSSLTNSPYLFNAPPTSTTTGSVSHTTSPYHVKSDSISYLYGITPQTTMTSTTGVAGTSNSNSVLPSSVSSNIGSNTNPQK